MEYETFLNFEWEKLPYIKNFIVQKGAKIKIQKVSNVKIQNISTVEIQNSSTVEISVTLDKQKSSTLVI